MMNSCYFTKSGQATFFCRIQQHDKVQADDTDETRRPIPLSSVDLKVGVLHYTPGQEPFPLLLYPADYVPDTIDITERAELNYWVKILSGQIPIVAEKAIATDGGTEGFLSISSCVGMSALPSSA